MANETVPVVALYDHLRTHVAAESTILREYVDATERTESQALRYLVDLIVQDERRHHQLFADMAQTLQFNINVVGPGMTVPALDFERETGPETAQIVERLLSFELEDKRELKQLHKQVVGLFGDSSLYGLLVENMQRDTDKHIAILRFVKKHLGRRRPAARRRSSAA